MERLKSYQNNLVLVVILAVLAFFWIWLYQYIGGSAYWAALIAFAVYVAGGAKARSLPWMTLGGVVGVVLGLLTFALANLIFPPYAVISAAIAGAIFLLIIGLISIPRITEIMPMAVVGWAVFLGAMARFDFLFTEKVVWANTKAFQTFFGVLLSVMVGLVLGALVATPLLAAKRAPVHEETGGEAL